MNHKLLISITLAASLAGCAMSPAQLASSTDSDVCRSYGIYRKGIGFGAMADSYKQEIKQRGLMTDDEWARASTGSVRIGDSACAMYVAWGRPDRENHTATANTSRTQHIFDTGYTYIKPTYIYTQNNRVVAIQN